jgi:hypothetical protein
MQDRADQADKFTLYLEAVQNPRREVAFIMRTFLDCRGRLPRTLREDFSGTAAVACEWVRRDERNQAIGVDIDEEPLGWSRSNLVPRLREEEAARVKLVLGDALEVETGPVDVVFAGSGSVCALRSREHLRDYFRRSYDTLDRDGMIVLQVPAGPEMHMTGTDRIQKADFTYVWEQESFNSMTHEAVNHIHFEFADRPPLIRAFSYRWRVWSPVELKEALEESGFAEVATYRASTEPDSSSPQRCNEVYAASYWDAYVVGLK